MNIRLRIRRLQFSMRMLVLALTVTAFICAHYGQTLVELVQFRQFVKQYPSLKEHEVFREWAHHLETNKDYSPQQLRIVNAEVELTVYSDLSDETLLGIWQRKWGNKIESFSLTGGCGCCVDIYTIRGPRAAIEEFPIHPLRRKYYPKYLSDKATHSMST